MIQLYADGELVYDRRLNTHSLLALTYTAGLNKAGTATFTLPPNHPKYGSFISFRTLVELFKNGDLVFRGRALFPSDDFYNQRTITCEGERSFFRDVTMRPYLYQDEPAAIFATVVNYYNSQVEEFKQFVVGEVTVTDANNYVRLENTKASKVSEVIDKLVERCGGYVVFTTNEAGKRVVNWYAELGYRSGQPIEFGKNLTDFTSEDMNSNLATVLIPYGAQIDGAEDELDNRVTIESVNGGLDFIQDDEAIALRGIIQEAIYWDDVTEPVNLLRKAQAELASRRNVITSLKLTAADLSNMDENIDTFQLGDKIPVLSKPHGLDEDFLLTEKSEDCLNDSVGSITLGKERKTLTGLGVAGDRNSASELQKTERNIRAEYKANVAAVVEEAKRTLTSLIQQTSDHIKLEVSETYATNGEVDALISTSMTQLKDSFDFLFTTLEQTVEANDENTRAQFNEIEKYIRFVDGNIILGESGSDNALTLKIENDRISFLDDGAEVAYFSNKQLVVLDGHFLNSMRIGAFQWVPRQNGNLSLVRLREEA